MSLDSSLLSLLRMTCKVLQHACMRIGKPLQSCTKSKGVQGISLLHSNLCSTHLATAFHAHKVIAPVQMSEANVLCAIDRFCKRFDQVTRQVKHLHTHHRRYRLHHDQLVVRIAELDVVHCNGHDGVFIAFAAR